MRAAEDAIGWAVLGVVSGAGTQLGPVDTELGAGVTGEEIHVRQSGPATPLAVELLLDTVDVELEPADPAVIGVDDKSELIASAGPECNGSSPDNLAVGARATGNGVLDGELVRGVEVDVERNVLGRCGNLIAFLPVLFVTYKQMIHLQTGGGGGERRHNIRGN